MPQEIALPRDFWERLPLRSDEELYEVLANDGDYLPEALEVVKAELARRNLPMERAAQLEAAAQAQKMAEAKVTKPLSWPMRIFICVFFIFVFLGLCGHLLRYGADWAVAVYVIILAGLVILRRKSF